MSWMEGLRIRICVPFYHSVSAPTVLGIQDCLRHRFIHWDVASAQGPYIGQNRNTLVNQGKSAAVMQNPSPEIDFFLFVDADIAFTWKDVQELLTGYRELHAPNSILSGAYLRQKSKTDYTAGKWIYRQPGFVDPGNALTVRSSKSLHQVDYVGGGFLLVPQAVFTLMPYPWFREKILNSVFTLDETRKEVLTAFQIGEDLGFCLDAWNEGFPIFCDTRVELGHIGRQSVDFQKLIRGI